MGAGPSDTDRSGAGRGLDGTRERSARRERATQCAAEAVAGTRCVDCGYVLGPPRRGSRIRQPPDTFRAERYHGRARAGSDQPLERSQSVRRCW